MLAKIPRDRLAYVEMLWLRAVPTQRIHRLVCKRYGITARSSRRYLALVQAKIASLPKPPPEAEAARIEAMLLESYALARKAIKVVAWVDGSIKRSREYAAPETGAMVTATVRLGELHGLFTTKVEHSGSIETLSPESLHARLAAIAARATGRPDTEGAGEAPADGTPGDRSSA